MSGSPRNSAAALTGWPEVGPLPTDRVLELLDEDLRHCRGIRDHAKPNSRDWLVYSTYVDAYQNARVWLTGEKLP